LIFIIFLFRREIYYGKSAGCDFILKGCTGGPTPDRRECCPMINESACSFFYESKSYCSVQTFSDGNLAETIYSNGNCEVETNKISVVSGETFSTGSKCFLGTLIQKLSSWPNTPVSLCHKYECLQGKIIITTSTGATVECIEANQKAYPQGDSMYEGYIICPDPAVFCKANFFYILYICRYLICNFFF
jgi:hypothetical protein